MFFVGNSIATLHFRVKIKIMKSQNRSFDRKSTASGWSHFEYGPLN